MDLLIIGAGPAGLAAAIYAARAQLSVLVVDSGVPGGQITQTHEIANYPGFAEPISGLELAGQMTRQAEGFGARLEMDHVSNLRAEAGGFVAETWSGEVRARSVIIATGATPRRLGIPGEERFWGRGVSSCATCDAPFFKDQVVAVVGGGDAAVEEAEQLSRVARRVILVHRRDELRAHRSAQAALRARPNVEFRWNAQAREILGQTQVSGLQIEAGGQQEVLDVTGVFVLIGHTPATGFLPPELLDEHGYVRLTGDVTTSIPGLFVAGDAADPDYRQLATSVGTGARSALQAERWLRTQG